MEVITPEIIQYYLRSHLVTLSGVELLGLHKCLSLSPRVEELPADLRDALHLREYLLTRNLTEIIFSEFEKLIGERCSLGKLVTAQQIQLIEDGIQNRREAYLEKSKDDDSIKTDSFSFEADDDLETESPVLLEYINFLFEKLSAKVRIDDFKVTPKLDGDLITIVVEQPVMLLSKTLDQVEKWLNILPARRRKQVHFIARNSFYIDCSLNNGQWHGTSILVMSNKIKCLPGSHIWDISGKMGKWENGGHVLMIGQEMSDMGYLKIISNGGDGGAGLEEEISLNFITSMFPPSTSSDTLRKLVFENGIKFGNMNKKHLQFNPTDAYDPETGKITGPITDFYLEGETERGWKYYMGFRKGMFTKNAFCLFQDKQSADKMGNSPNGNETPGSAAFYSLDNLESAIPLQQLGVKVVAEGRKTGTIESGGVDVGYVALNSKHVIEYDCGHYELKMEDSEMPDSVQCKLLGKWLRICEKNTDSQTNNNIKSNDFKTGADIINCKNPKAAVQMYDQVIGADAEEKLMKKLLSKYESEWWTKRILNSN